jgi:2-dehydropantoate 2-reductase
VGTADNIASMLQDVLAQRATEIGFINGAIVREGRRLGIPTPVNLTLNSLVEALQDSYEDTVSV